jgi:murein DD-endopeptidase MepM/ murein hydrolase activator NlpD
VKQRLTDKLNARLERGLPEQRLFLKSDEGTRFVRMRPLTQAGLLLGGAALVGWTVIVTSFFLLGAISSGSVRDQAQRAAEVYEARLAEISVERDARTREAEDALGRFYTALDEVSKMQGELLTSEQRRRELETAVEVVQATLRRTIGERDAALAEVEATLALADGAPEAAASAQRLHADAAAMTAALADILEVTARQRDDALGLAGSAESRIDRMEAMADLVSERNDRIFTRLEEALQTSMEPLEQVFRRTGVSPDALLDTVRRGYSGQGGPLEPLIVSTRGAAATDPDLDTERANRLLDRLAEVDMYRLAAESLPLAHPVPGPHRRTSGFGPRWGRMHSGLDFAASRGSAIHSTAEGVVTFAGWQGGYGKLVKVRHALGFETRYAHLNRIRVEVGQRISRGERIGDMGTTGRSTGVHLHYEIRRGGTALNPSTFIDAGEDVF